MPQKINFYFITLFALALLLSLAAPVLAQTTPRQPWFQLVPEGCVIKNADSVNCTEPAECQEAINRECGVKAIFQTIVNVSNLLLRLTGSVALLMFMYGGARWILAAGKQEWVSAGTAAMTAAVIGIVIILTSWLIVNFTILALNGEPISGQAQIFGTDWFQER